MGELELFSHQPGSRLIVKAPEHTKNNEKIKEKRSFTRFYSHLVLFQIPHSAHRNGSPLTFSRSQTRAGERLNLHQTI